MASQHQVERMLAMIPYLVNNPGVSVEQVCATFGITRKQLLVDLNSMWMVGLPGGLPDDLIDIDMDAVEEHGTITVMNADFLARPMRFRLDEAATLLVALQAVRELATGEQLAAADRVVDKLTMLARGVTEEELARTVAVSLDRGSDDVRGAISSALTNRQQLRLTYDGAVRGETTQPVVDPAVVVTRSGVAYLHAWSHERADWRLYRLDRIARADVLDSAVIDHGQPPTLSVDWFDDLSADNEVTLTLKPEAAWVKEYHPTREVSTADDGNVRITFAVSNPVWLTGLLLQLGGGVVAVEPPEAAEAAVAAAQEALAAYS